MRFGDVDDVADGIIKSEAPFGPRKLAQLVRKAGAGLFQTADDRVEVRRLESILQVALFPALRAATRYCRKSTSRHRSPASSRIRACTLRRPPDGPVSLPGRLRVLVDLRKRRRDRPRSET